jgi:hypothetical protein
LHFAQRGRPFVAAGTRFFAPQEGQTAMLTVTSLPDDSQRWRPDAMTPRALRQDISDQREAALRMLPRLAKDPMEATEKVEPMHPIEAKEPTDPIDNVEPVEPMESRESREAIDHFEPAG